MRIYIKTFDWTSDITIKCNIAQCQIYMARAKLYKNNEFGDSMPEQNQHNWGGVKRLLFKKSQSSTTAES